MSTLMPIKVCIAGATGWAGSAVTRRILQSGDFQLAGAIARQSAGRDIGEVLGGPAAGIAVVPSLEDVLPVQPDVLIDYTTPDSVKARTFAALDHGLRVVIGTSGLTAEDYHEIDAQGPPARPGRDCRRQLFDHGRPGKTLCLGSGQISAVVGDH